MSTIKNSGLEQYGKVLSFNGIGGERVNRTRLLFWQRNYTVWRIVIASRRVRAQKAGEYESSVYAAKILRPISQAGPRGRGELLGGLTPGSFDELRKL